MLTAAVLGLQIVIGRWLPARWRHAMWLPVVLVLMAPVLPESRFSAESYFRGSPTATAAAPAVDLRTNALAGIPISALTDRVEGS